MVSSVHVQEYTLYIKQEPSKRINIQFVNPTINVAIKSDMPMSIQLCIINLITKKSEFSHQDTKTLD